MVTHVGKPVPLARVELRKPGWAVTGAEAVAIVQADSQGAFSLLNPPEGEFSVIGLFPDGEADAGGWPVVDIAPGQEITGFVVPLERRLTLVSPAEGATTDGSPTLSWQAADEAAQYRLLLIDAGTTALLADLTTEDTHVEISPELKPGTYQWAVDAENATGDILATGTAAFVVEGAPATPEPEGEAEGLPPSCRPRSGETEVYADRERGFCFLYPAGFTEVTGDSGMLDVVGVVRGPALDSSPDPLAATLLVEVSPAASADLDAEVEALVQEFQSVAGVDITQRDFDLGGVPAVLLEGVPGRGGSRDVVAVQDDTRYRLLFMPDPEAFPAAAADLEALFDAVTGSFTLMLPASSSD
jgi:hypothetical protein